jgi:hypothetical protein
MSVAVSTTEIPSIPLQLTTQKHRMTSIHNEHPVSQKLHNAHSSRCYNFLFFFFFFFLSFTLGRDGTFIRNTNEVTPRHKAEHHHALAGIRADDGEVLNSKIC